MVLKLFKFLEPFLIDTFLLKVTQFEKTGSISKLFISLGDLIIKFHFSNLEVDHVFCDLYTFAVR